MYSSLFRLLESKENQIQQSYNRTDLATNILNDSFGDACNIQARQLRQFEAKFSFIFIGNIYNYWWFGDQLKRFKILNILNILNTLNIRCIKK